MRYDLERKFNYKSNATFIFFKFTLFRKIYDFIYKIDTLYHGLKHVKAYIFRNKINLKKN